MFAQQAELAQRKYSSIEILLLKCKIMVRGRISNKSWFVDYDPVRARAEGRAPTGMDAGTTALFPDGFEETELRVVKKGWRVGGFDELLILQRCFDLPSDQRVHGPNQVVYARLQSKSPCI
jgi:hypothetical protein